MNPVDIAVAVLCLWFAVWGIARGLVNQLVSIGGLIAGHLAGARYYGSAVSLLRLSFEYADVAGYLAVFLAAYLAVRLVGAFLEGKVRDSKLSGADRLGGMAAGILKGALLSILLVFLLVVVLPKDARVLRESKAAPVAISAGRRIAAAFPEGIAGTFREKARAVERAPFRYLAPSGETRPPERKRAPK